MNLLGAICGGLLEYNSMYFGFQFLYLIAIGCYLLAFVSELASGSRWRDDDLKPNHVRHPGPPCPGPIAQQTLKLK